MITIGKRELISSFPNLLIPKNENAVLDIEVIGWKLKIFIQFDDITDEQSIKIEAIEGGVRLIFGKWSSSIGTALKEPAALANLHDGTHLEFMASNYRIGDTNLFSIQFLHNKDLL